MKSEFSWDDLRLFLHVARLGGLSAATHSTGLSAPTLGRRVAALEREFGEPLFERSQSGYRLTRAGEDLLVRAEEVELAMLALRRWKDGAVGERVVRLSAGPWTSHFLSTHIDTLWSVEDRFALEFVTAAQTIDIGRRNADIGVRSQRPTDPWLAGRMVGRVAYAIYGGRNFVGGVQAGYFVGLSGASSQVPSARWLQARHGDRIVVRGNDAQSVRELVAASAGLSVFPCFVGDSDPRLVRAAAPIAELETEQWLVCHHEERHEPAVRAVTERVAALLQQHGDLFAGAGGAGAVSRR